MADRKKDRTLIARARREEITEVVTGDLRALLFWANVGVAKSTSGSYREIDNIIESYAKHLNFPLPYHLGFGAKLRVSRKGATNG